MASFPRKKQEKMESRYTGEFEMLKIQTSLLLKK